MDSPTYYGLTYVALAALLYYCGEAFVTLPSVRSITIAKELCRVPCSETRRIVYIKKPEQKPSGYG